MRKRKNCTRRPSSTLSETETVTTAEVPEPSTTKTKTETITPTTSAAPVCSDEAEYSSACSCISAVGDVTSTIYKTVSSATPSVSESIVNVVVTTVVVKPATVTTTTTVSTDLETTTTVTSVVQPTQTSKLVLANGPRQGRHLTLVSNYVQYDINNVGAGVAVELGYVMSGGQPWVASNHSVKLHLHQSSALVGVLYMETAAAAATYGDPAVTCSVGENGLMSCTAPAKGFDTIWNCGAYLHLAKSTWSQAGCVMPNFRRA
ncbi:hypothetical protein B0T21DRAFT_173459 [Apiosordaria backusii]|uniref:Uncharacterized protein n=1 Tax=Apiosordaria backusii TaxID=314023 RepID=A0AA40BKW5_9PEZI|nr:hypothetical protein B0T21DRAFT_173459 [Apiosordaria backusii]